MRWLSIAMTAVFLLAVAVQWNDPDPMLWTALYGAAALVSLATALGRYKPRATIVLGAVYAVGVLWNLPAVLDADLSAYTSFKMRSADDELARECIGLLLCALWMLAVWWKGRSLRDRG